MEDRRTLYEAAKRHDKQVTFRDGRTFNCKYSIVTGSIAWDTYEAVFISPTWGGFAPCGWFHINFLPVEE